ncbi:MAG: alcohol dehydrogenase catalytic domain-containing protein [Comamonadaceae bacterium]|nr:alcohol dehydrogenase catalytic domain-containing protein [Comamonadaceae bacterium]
MFRSGMYLETPALPSRLGYEAAGTVEAVGPGVTGIKAGERVSTIPAFQLSEVRRLTGNGRSSLPMRARPIPRR